MVICSVTATPRRFHPQFSKKFARQTKMKKGSKLCNFRLTPQAVTHLDELAKHWGCSKTEAVERALAALATTKFKGPLLKPKEK